jgi:tetratricopeptide (TPR) repeat protein
MRLLAAAALLLVALGGSAHADDADAAKQAYSEGARRYAIGDFRGALEDFKRSYLAFPAPDTLFNLAQCHRQLGEHGDAIRAFRNYLELMPPENDRSEVERLIADEEKALSPAPPVPEANQVEPPPPAPVEKAPPPSPPPPPRRRWILPVGVAAAVVVIAAVTLGLAFGLTHEPADPSVSAGVMMVHFP